MSNRILPREHADGLAMSSASDTLTIEELADSEARLRERVASLDADVKIYAALTKQTLQLLHEKNVKCDRQQVRILALAGDLRLAHADVRAMGAQLRAWQESAA